ncbi:MAG: aminopeptidase P family protein [Saprospiraceae bacterium]
MLINDKLKLLRSKMVENSIDAYLIPSSDPHQSEYVADHFKSREWISGFTGSAGTVVVFKDFAGMWTDSRYFIQAENEFKDSEFQLMKIIDRSNPGIIDFILSKLPEGSTLGCDGNVFALEEIIDLQEKISQKKLSLNTNLDFIGELWKDRPSLPGTIIFDHFIKYAGKSREEKMNEVRNIMAENNINEYLIPALDSIAWILNLRGDDIAFNPVFYSFGILREKDFLLFIDEKKIDEKLKAELSQASVIINEYSEIYNYLSKTKTDDTLYVDSALCNFNLYNSISCKIKTGVDYVSELKAIKNNTEIDNLKQAHVQDGVSLVKFFRWLEQELKTRTVSEFEAGEQLANFRSMHSGYISESFEPIVGFGKNGAIVHYSASENECSDITDNGMLLVDSGGQYLNGTTDITRTIYFGNPDDIEKSDYTAVLKGHLAVKKLIFPEGINGFQIDVFARQYLWDRGLNFYHGTGHGVGFFLNVHEGPQGITNSLVARAKVPIKVGMLTSNEPGYYKEGHYGIRIENLILAVSAMETEHGKFIKHEDVTLFPYETKLINFSMLERCEVQQINEYHAKVYDSLSPFLDDDEKNWLEDKCRKI